MNINQLYRLSAPPLIAFLLYVALVGFMSSLASGHDVQIKNSAAADIQTQQNSTAAPNSASSGFMALWGSEKAVDDFTKRYSDVLELLRIYPNPQAYLAEAPGRIRWNENIDTLRLYQVTPPTADISRLLNDLKETPNIRGTAETSWLSYMPGEFMLSGDCSDVDVFIQSHEQLERILTLGGEIKLSDPLCIRRYIIEEDTEKVANLVERIMRMRDEERGDIYAEPIFITGALQPIIHGSPGAQTGPGAPPLDLPETASAGSGVSVVVFDNYSTPANTPTRDTITVAGVPISVTSPFDINPNAPQQSRNIETHGTIVVNAITELVPDADIRLIRVLNADGYGTTYQLMAGIQGVISRTLPISNSFSGVVFNYSLGLDTTATLTTSNALSEMLSYVDSFNIVQIAAAGNDSAFTLIPQPMRLPAAHPKVIGISALTTRRQPACYANQGEFFVIGGGVERGLLCRVKRIVLDCSKGVGNANCITGGGGPPKDNYWGVGTSFAAPRVSGVAAAIIAAGRPTSVSNGITADGPTAWTKPAIVRAALADIAANLCDPNARNALIYAPGDCALGLPQIWGYIE
ncbi:MAG: S8/S53 family peptidase [Caldilineaceae bacterium]